MMNYANGSMIKRILNNKIGDKWAKSEHLYSKEAVFWVDTQVLEANAK